MKTIFITVIFAAIFLTNISALAVEQTIVLNVNGMTCVTCPHIVQKTLVAVDGVAVVEVFFTEKSAVVTYEDSKTAPAILIQAVVDIGFPSTLKEPIK